MLLWGYRVDETLIQHDSQHGVREKLLTLPQPANTLAQGRGNVRERVASHLTKFEAAPTKDLVIRLFQVCDSRRKDVQPKAAYEYKAHIPEVHDGGPCFRISFLTGHEHTAVLSDLLDLVHSGK